MEPFDPNTSRTNEKKSTLKKALLIAFIVMLVLLVGWYLFLPVLGVATVMTAAALGTVVATVILVAVAVLLFYILSGIGIVILAVLASIWIIFSITLFPFVFPLLIPLLIILIFVAFIRRHE